MDANSYPNPDHSEDEGETNANTGLNKNGKFKSQKEQMSEKMVQQDSKSVNQQRINAKCKPDNLSEKENEPPQLATEDQDKSISKLTIDSKPKLSSGKLLLSK